MIVSNIPTAPGIYREPFDGIQLRKLPEPPTLLPAEVAGTGFRRVLTYFMQCAVSVVVLTAVTLSLQNTLERVNFSRRLCHSAYVQDGDWWILVRFYVSVDRELQKM